MCWFALIYTFIAGLALSARTRDSSTSLGMTRIYIDMEFYDSPAAAEMAESYKQHIQTPLIKIGELLHEARELEQKIDATHRILLRRRRVRMELKLMRILLAVLDALTPEQQELGGEIYVRLGACVDRLEKLC